MDSDKLQKLANLAIVRQHAAAVTASTNFPRKYINNVNSALGTLDSEFFQTLIEAVGDIAAEDAVTISKRLIEEKAKLKAQAEYKGDLSLESAPLETVKSENRPTIKTARAKKEK